MTPAWRETLPRVWGTDTSLPLGPGKPSLLLLLCCCAEAALLQLSSQDQGFSFLTRGNSCCRCWAGWGFAPDGTGRSLGCTGRLVLQTVPCFSYTLAENRAEVFASWLGSRLP